LSLSRFSILVCISFLLFGIIGSPITHTGLP
jgi:hypothetical protein